MTTALTALIAIILAFYLLPKIFKFLIGFGITLILFKIGKFLFKSAIVLIVLGFILKGIL